MNYLNVTKKSAVLQRLIGLNPKEFNLLAKNVKIEFRKYQNKTNMKKDRKRLPGGGRKSKLITTEDKLLLTLLYYKSYITQEFLGEIFDINQSNVSRVISLMSKIIENAADPQLNEYLEEGRRNAPLDNNFIKNQADFIRKYPDLEEIATDATESPCQRPKDSSANKKFYSGKSKRHTIKTEVTVSSTHKILNVTDSYPGSVHDKTITEKEGTVEKITKYSRYLVDKGYFGIQKICKDINILMPFKKPKGEELTSFQKQINRYLSGKRVFVEHIIGKLKNNRIISDVYRGPISSFNQVFRNIAAIWNFKLTVAAP